MYVIEYKISGLIGASTTLGVNKMDDLVSDVKKEIGEDFDSKVDLVYKIQWNF